MRRHFLDNTRYTLVLAVVFYHVFYIFNSIGVITNVAIPGIPALDAVMYILYPWFMVCLFVISGASARYALEKQNGKIFWKRKLKRILLPSVAGIFLLGWVNGFVTSRYTDMFAGSGDLIPGFVKFLIYCISGIGPLWYLHELMLCYGVLLLLRKLDQKDTLWRLGGRATLPVLLLLALGLWGSAQVLNTPVIEIYRNGIYLFAFLAGFYVFSHDRVQALLGKFALPLAAAAAVLCAVYTATYWGENFTTLANLKSLLTNLYAWFGTLAVLGLGKRYLDRETRFTHFMGRYSFGYYLFHYPLLITAAWVMDQFFHWPAALLYPALLVWMALAPPLMTRLVRKVPLLRTLLLGE